MQNKTKRPYFKKTLQNGRAIPIKDICLIQKIKDIYRKNKEYRGLLMFILAINTGLKTKDLLELKVEDVLNKDVLNIMDEPTKEIVSFALTKEIKEIVPLVVKNREKDDYLFKTKFGNKLDRSAVYLQFNEITKELKINDKYSPQSWRKTFAYHYYKTTNDISKIMYLFHQGTIRQAFEFINEEQHLNFELDRKFAL